MAISDQLSGIALNQNATATNVLSSTGDYYQSFILPGDYVRGGAAATALIPQLTGFQLFANVSSTTGATFSWSFDWYESAWTSLATGVLTGAPLTGLQWLTALFTAPIVLPSLTASYRIRLTAFADLSLECVAPNPIATSGLLAHTSGDTPVTFSSQNCSLGFRVLAAIADEGADFFGNTYRSVAVNAAAGNVNPIADEGAYWLSSPSPSYFGVEAMYLDVRDAGASVVLDRVTIDPLTPGVVANLYFSEDPTGPGVDSATWDNLLWTPIYSQFVLNSVATYAFPNPITAKWVKIEFTNLQAEYYDPGQFQVPTQFRKYPQWVLSYFLTRFAAQELDLISSSVDVTYDLLDLAFTYYQGDLTSSPDAPALSLLNPNTNQSLSFLQGTADTLSPLVAAQLQVAFQPYLTQPALSGAPNSLLSSVAVQGASASYSVESLSPAVANTTVVSNTNRESLLVEKGMPVMFFYLPCRHQYRISQSLYSQNVAYFAGVNQIAFHRDVYTGRLDQEQYNECLGDGQNILIWDTHDYAAMAPLT